MWAAACHAGSVLAAPSSTATPHNLCPTLNGTSPTSRRSPRGVDEVLLVPFYVAGKAVGTIWVIVHDQSHRFDTEDLRIMTNLGTFAAAAYQTLQYLKSAELANEHLESEVLRRTGALQQLSAKLMRSQDEERRRIARNLHDSLGQDLTSIKMNLESLRRSGCAEQETEVLASALESVGTKLGRNSHSFPASYIPL